MRFPDAVRFPSAPPRPAVTTTPHHAPSVELSSTIPASVGCWGQHRWGARSRTGCIAAASVLTAVVVVCLAQPSWVHTVVLPAPTHRVPARSRPLASPADHASPTLW